MDDDDKEQYSVKKKHVDSSRGVEETKHCDPSGSMWEGASDHAAECKDVISMEVIIEPENEHNKTLDNDREHSVVEPEEESSTPTGVHCQQVKSSEDGTTEQQEPNDCVQEGTRSGHLDNMKTLQYVTCIISTTLYQRGRGWRGGH